MSPQPTPQSRPENAMNAREPMRAIKKPDSGTAHVPSAMKNVNPHCTSESDQPVAVMNGLTKNVQAYCRLPIRIITKTAARSRTQRFTIFLFFADSDEGYRVVAISSGTAAPSARGSDAA